MKVVEQATGTGVLKHGVGADTHTHTHTHGFRIKKKREIFRLQRGRGEGTGRKKGKRSYRKEKKKSFFPNSLFPNTFCLNCVRERETFLLKDPVSLPDLIN